MKRILALLMLNLAVCYIHAQSSRLLIDENFTNYSTGDLNNSATGQGGWRPLFTNNGTDFVKVENTIPLIYSNYTSGSQYINVLQKDDFLGGSWKYPDDPHKSFNNGAVVISLDSTIFYISFLVRVPEGGMIASSAEATPNIALRTMNGSTFAHFYIGSAENGRGVKFGIKKDGLANAVFTSPIYEFNSTYLIILRYDVTNGSATSDYDDKMYMWVNPSLSSQPKISTSQVAIDNLWDFKFDGGFNTAAQSLELFQNAKSATASFDAFKVACAQGFGTSSANATAAWETLSPKGSPLVEDYRNFKGYAKNNSIQLQWSSNNQYANLLNYEVEHSIDGVHFSSIANVMIKKGKGDLMYEWTDRFPSNGNNYYRLKSVYAEGDFQYSKTVKISLESASSFLTLYPNPVSGKQVSIVATSLEIGEYKIEIFTSAGQQVYAKQLKHSGGTLNQLIDLPSNLQKGIYNVLLLGTSFKMAKPFLVQ